MLLAYGFSILLIHWLLPFFLDDDCNILCIIQQSKRRVSACETLRFFLSAGWRRAFALRQPRRSLPLYRSLLFRVSPYQRGNIHKQLDIHLSCAPIMLLNGRPFSLVGQSQLVEEDPVGAL